MNNSVSTVTGKTKIKIVFLGNQAVGKSSIIEKYVKDVFDETSNPTVGIDFLVKNVAYKAKNFRLQLWDTAGQERFRSLIPNYLKDAKCALIVIDVTNKASLNSADNWVHLYNDNKTGEGFTFLIGNKIDLEYREVSQEEALKKAEELGIPYFQVSAKTGENVENLFYKLIDVCQEQSLSAANFSLAKDSGVIREQENDANEDEKPEKSEKVQTSPEPQDKGTIVLKNVQIDKKSEDKKKGKSGCC